MIEASKFVFARSAGAAALVAGMVVLGARDVSADGPPPLPPEAYAACQSKSAGDACEVQIHDMVVHGSCVAHPSDSRLFCRPDRPPMPPPQAFEACNGKKVSDSCSVELDGHAMNGTCLQTPDSRLVCAPPLPSGGPLPMARRADDVVGDTMLAFVNEWA